MSGIGGRSTIGRGLAGMVLASFLLSFAPPRAPAAQTGPNDCLEHHPAAGALTEHHASHGDDCTGGPGQDCRTMPGCTAPVAAVAIGPVALFAAPAPHTLAAARAPLFHGLDALGPPTPPPNS